MIASLALLPVLLAAAAAEPAGGSARGGAPAGWFDVRSHGAKGDGRTDDSRAFQAALDAARAAGGGVVYVPAGTYVVAPPAPPGGGPRLGSLTLGSNVWLRGDGPASVLRVKPGIGGYRALFSNHPTPASPVENVVVSDLRIDQGCAASGGKVRVGPDGADHFIVYLAWAGRNLTVERVLFDAVCGINTVVLNSPEARGLVVRDCRFRFVKGPSDEPGGFYDNTAVYVHGQGAIVTGNSFEATAADGARAAIELHGTRGLAANNMTRWYHACVRAVGTSGDGEPPPRAQNGFTIVGNVCSDAKDAINVWPLTRHHVRGVTIVGNTIRLAELDHLAHTGQLRYFMGISFVWESVSGRLEGDVSDVVVEGNTITAQRADGVWRSDAASTGGIVLTSMGNISNVVVRGNVVRDVATKGIHVQSMGSGRARGVRIEGNVVVDAGNDPSAGEQRAGILVGGVLQDVEVAHNSIVGTLVPFRGRYAIRATPARGSARVGIHDNVWSTADRAASYELAAAGDGVDAGIEGRTASLALAPRPGEAVSTDAGTARTWDLTILGPNGFSIRAPRNAVPGQRLTIRLRNGHGGPLGPVRWDGFKLGGWSSPAPRHHRVLEVSWDGSSWCELFQSGRDVPN